MSGATLKLWESAQKRVAIGQNANGWLAVFFVGFDDSIWHDYENPDGPDECDPRRCLSIDESATASNYR
jgi:hypothetical protein